MNEVQPRRHSLYWILLTAIMLLAAFFRLYRLPVMPWGLSQDEVVNADISLSLLEGGHVPFLASGYGHEPLFHYLQAAALVLFGDSAIGIRMPAVIAGMLLIAASYTLIHQWFGRITALATAAGLAVSWWPIIFSRIGIRAVTFPLLFTLAAHFFGQGIKVESERATHSPASYGRFTIAGICLGATFYTYTAANVVLALVPVWLLYGLIFQRTALQKYWRGVMVTLCTAAALAIPLFLYLRAHPELTERLQQLSEPLDELQRGNIAPLWQSTRATLGMFSFDGEGRWTYGIPSRPILGPVSGALFYLGLLLCTASFPRHSCGLMLTWLVVALTPSMLTPDAPSTIRAIGALPAVYGMIGIAIGWLWRNARKHSYVMKIVLATALAILLIVNAAWTLRDGFQTWAAHPSVYWLYKAHFADIAFFLDNQAEPQPSIVYEEWVAPLDINGLRRDLHDDTRQPRWVQAGRAFIWPADATEFTLAVPIYSSTDADIWRLFAGHPPVLATSSYKMEDGRPGVTFYAAKSEPILTQTLERSSMGTILTPDQSHRLTAPVDFGDEYALLGYEVLGDAMPGAELRVVTIWRVAHDAPVDSSTFLHILDANGALVSQHDGFDVWTPALKANDIVVQLHTMEIPPDAAPGSYRIQTGLYLRAQEERLPVLVNGEALSDRVWLDTVEVVQ